MPEWIDHTGYGLGMVSDLAVEAMHQECARRLEASLYVIKDKDCEKHSNALLNLCIMMNFYTKRLGEEVFSFMKRTKDFFVN